MTFDFRFMTISALNGLLEKKSVSPVELTEQTIALFEELEPTLNMFAAFDPGGARMAAREAEERMMNGERRGPLDGVPTSIKDLLAQKGLPMRSGSRASSEAPASLDAPVVERLREAGAVLLGKTTTSEFGCKAVGDSPLTGITRNPWNTNLTPGGSSCGAAASVASGITPYAIGTDGGGSLRIPGALCGLVGFKAQFGRVPIHPTIATPTLGHVGPLARTTEDTAIVLNAIAGFDRRDPFAVTETNPSFDPTWTFNRPLRIAWSPTLGYARADPDMLSICESAVKRIEALGHSVEHVETVLDEDPVDLWNAEFYAGVGTRLRSTIENQPELLDPSVLDLLRTAITQDMKSYYEAVFARYDLRDVMRTFFQRFDLLLTPTVPSVAFEVGHSTPPSYEDRSIVSWVYYTYPFNLTGQPAASIPVGLNEAGLPVGLQIVAPSHLEERILQLSAAYEASNPFPRMPVNKRLASEYVV